MRWSALLLRSGLLSIALLAGTEVARGAPPAVAPAPRDVSALLAPLVAKHDVPALAGGIVVGSELVAVGCDGVRRRGSPERVTPTDRWHLGSCTKAMTATLCALLVEDGKLAWEQTLGTSLGAEALAGWKADPLWAGVTLEQLLTHRSGAPSDLSAGGLWGRLWERRGTPREQRQQLLEGLLPQPPVSAPGSSYLYSNAGYAVAGLLAERATDSSYEALLAKRLFAPLGITSGGFGAPGTAGAADQPRGHDGKGQPVEPGPQADNPPAIAPAGTVHMTLADWGRFVALHLEGPAGRSKLLPKSVFQRLHTAPPKAEPLYAAGWIVAQRPWGGTVLTHSGSNTMWYCVAWLAPERGFAVLLCCNEGGGKAEQACDEAASVLIGAHGRAGQAGR